MKRKVISILLAFLIISMTACGSTEESSSSSNESPLKPSEMLMESKDSDSMAEEQTEGRNESVSAQYAVGDIVLADGSIVKETDLVTIDDSNVPIAVIAGFQEDGTAFGVGVHRSDVPLQWVSDDSAGYSANFTNTVCTQKSEHDFLGDIDGRDNWEAICSQDGEDTADAAVYYPAYHFVNTYAETYNLSGNVASGWYMLSIAELCDIYQNREAVNNSLQRIYGLDEGAAMNGLEINWYWSSSQAGVEDDYVWFVHYFNDYAGECPKNFTNVHVLVVRAF